MPVFFNEIDANADQDFVDWIEANSNGFVINRKGPHNLLLHAASCSHFKPHGDWAKAKALKACSLDRLKLQGWADVEYDEDVYECPDCL